ncbi:Uncharacterised protein [Escherichia coli]|uniref:Uncharacterized protein n=1 Tax=Escherichia coli TaxID=562 RepID=A0A3S4K074_ECOLX|nr:Uncharacterised protein [Escherichia coli]
MRLIVGMTGATGAPLGCITASAAGDAECRDSSGDVEVGENHH